MVQFGQVPILSKSLWSGMWNVKTDQSRVTCRLWDSERMISPHESQRQNKGEVVSHRDTGMLVADAGEGVNSGRQTCVHLDHPPGRGNLITASGQHQGQFPPTPLPFSPPHTLRTLARPHLSFRKPSWREKLRSHPRACPGPCPQEMGSCRMRKRRKVQAMGLEWNHGLRSAPP